MKGLKIVFYIILIMVLALSVVSCGGKKKKTKHEPMESKIAKDAIDTVNSLKNAYESIDTNMARRLTTSKGFDQYKKSLKAFQNVELSFTTKWVDIDRHVIKVYMAWDGTWTASGYNTSETGLAVFVMKGSPPVIDEVLRANPFAQPL